MRRARSDARPGGRAHGRGQGFTLVELVVSIALIGLLSMAAIPLLKLPLEGWMDATRRSTLTTELDLVHAKLQDDMAHALPGSVRLRTVGTRRLLEYLEVRASGRYRAQIVSGASQCPVSCSGTVGANDALEAACSESCFVNLSPWDGGTPSLAATDWVVVNPMGPISPYTAGAAGIRTQALAANATGRVDMTPHTFAALSPQRRFYIVTGPVTYECNTTTRRLTRYWNYGIATVQPTAFAGANSATLSARVQTCGLQFQAAGALNQAGSANNGGVVDVMLRLGSSLLEPTSSEVADLQASFAVSEGP